MRGAHTLTHPFIPIHARSLPSLFDLHHVIEFVADSLLFKDLVRCVLVNRTWHNVFSRFLYEDIITFRTRSVEDRIKRPRCSHFYDPTSRLGLIKHGHHIRAFTCRSVSRTSLSHQELSHSADLDDNETKQPETSTTAVQSLTAFSEILNAVRDNQTRLKRLDGLVDNILSRQDGQDAKICSLRDDFQTFFMVLVGLQ
ncbi:hypothetical protein BGZ59_007529 [Podila verticillata]|nr:hypothetical protein BGZ59_007529 [Podila verticillata]